MEILVAVADVDALVSQGPARERSKVAKQVLGDTWEKTRKTV